MIEFKTQNTAVSAHTMEGDNPDFVSCTKIQVKE